MLLVDPGVYGDLNHDGDFSDAGEEHADFGKGCVVCVTKQVGIFVKPGFGLPMLIDAGGVQPLSAVLIDADHVTFEDAVVRGGTRGGVRIGTHANNVKLRNIRAESNVSGDPSIRAAGFDITSRLGTIDISQSVAEDNDAGFVASTSATGRVSLTRNLAARNTDVGFSVAGTGSGRNLLDHDRAVSNGLGFQVSGANHRIDFSTALANAQGGFSIGGSNHGLAHDSAINNRGPGFLVVAGASGSTLRSTNTFGNVGAGPVGAAGWESSTLRAVR